MTQLLVCGGRDYDDRDHVFAVLDALCPEVVLQGGAQGADTLAALWAARNRRHCETMKADWKRHGKAAGPIRNQRMLDEWEPALVVAFPGGAGTEDMVRRAVKAGVPVLRVEPRPEADPDQGELFE